MGGSSLRAGEEDQNGTLRIIHPANNPVSAECMQVTTCSTILAAPFGMMLAKCGSLPNSHIRPGQGPNKTRAALRSTSFKARGSGFTSGVDGQLPQHCQDLPTVEEERDLAATRRLRPQEGGDAFTRKQCQYLALLAKIPDRKPAFAEAKKRYDMRFVNLLSIIRISSLTLPRKFYFRILPKAGELTFRWLDMTPEEVSSTGDLLDYQ